MNKKEIAEQVVAIRELMNDVHRKLNQIEAIYINNMYKSCSHVFDDKNWYDRDLTTLGNNCIVCGHKIIRQKVISNEDFDC